LAGSSSLSTRAKLLDWISKALIGWLQGSAILVLVASLIFAIVIGLIDLGFSNGLTWFYTLK
jgi:preprotein translocase subunit SecE